LNVTILTIEAMGGGGGGSGGGTGSDGAWTGGGSGALEKITIPATSRQVIDFTFGVGGGGRGEGSRGNGTAKTLTMYGQTANGGLGSTGINGL